MLLPSATTLVSAGRPWYAEQNSYSLATPRLQRKCTVIRHAHVLERQQWNNQPTNKKQQRDLLYNDWKATARKTCPNPNPNPPFSMFKLAVVAIIYWGTKRRRL